MQAAVIFRQGLRAMLATAMALCVVAAAQADEPYPSKPVRIIVPFAPGGGTDMIARLVAEKLGASLGQPFIVETKLGGGGIVGSHLAMSSKPDGYTLLVVSSSYAVSAAVSPFPFDPIADVTPVVQVVDSPMVVAVNSTMPVKTLAELNSYALANPNKISFGSTGYGTVAHLALEDWMQLTGAKAVHIPYQGMGPAINGIAAGDVQLVVSDTGAIAPMISAGRVRALAIAGTHRFAALANVPTEGEAGMPDLMLMTWYGVLAPKGTPPEIVAKLNGEVNRMLQSPEVVKTLENRFMTPVGGTPQHFGEVLSHELAVWKTLVAQRGIKPQ